MWASHPEQRDPWPSPNLQGPQPGQAFSVPTTTHAAASILNHVDTATNHNVTTDPDAPLRTVLRERECAQIASLRRRVALLETWSDALGLQLAACQKAAPALFVHPGTVLFHRRADNNDDTFAPDFFEYLGRDNGKGAVSRRLPHCPSSWLVFLHLEGDGFGRAGAGPGGFRDAVQAWPAKDFTFYHKDGSLNDREICLPPSMCAGFCHLTAEQHTYVESAQWSGD